MLNFAQLSATLDLRAVMEKTRGAVDEELLGRLQNSASDRNWDSIEALWRMKNEVRDDAELRAAFAPDDTTEIAGALRAGERGRRFIAERVEPYQREFGWHAVWSHEFIFPTVREQMEPVLELIRGYLATDYDFPTAIEAMRLRHRGRLAGDPRGPDRRGARGDAGRQRGQPAHGAADARPPLLHRPGRERPRAPGAPRGRPEARRARAASTSPTTSCSCATTSCGRSSAAPRRSTPGTSSPPAGQSARHRRSSRRATGSAPCTPSQLAFPYLVNWGYPERFHQQQSDDTRLITGIGASPGVVEGIARVVRTVDEFDEVRDGDILVCQMTNPAWVVLFTKIAGLVTDTGGLTSHPAVLSREFGIPAVIGTSVATQRIATGDRLRVDGTAGQVEIRARRIRRCGASRPTVGDRRDEPTSSSPRSSRPDLPSSGSTSTARSPSSTSSTT